MKKIIASALFFACALSMSAQSVQLIDNNQLKPEDVSAQLELDQFGMIAWDYSTDPSTINAIVKEINDMVASNPTENNKAWALDQLMEKLIVEEMKTGDVNLDGDFDTADAEYSFNSFIDGEDGFDFNGDGDFDSADAQALFNAFMGI